jgi:hypothetical protein
MATYYVDDGGDGTTENSWATADTSINALDAEYTFASGDIIYFGHNSVCQATNTANLTVTGPTSGAPVLFISATQGSSPAAYQASSTNQIDTTESTYNLIFDGSFAFYGMCVAAGGYISLNNDADELIAVHDCTLKPGNGRQIEMGSNSSSRTLMQNTTVSMAADSGATAAQVFSGFSYGEATLQKVTFTNGTNRTGVVVSASGGLNTFRASGCDFSTFTNATACEIVTGDVAGNFYFSNCITASTWTPMTTGRPTAMGEIWFVNCGPADDPTYLLYRNPMGDVASSSAIYRTGGASVEGSSCSWLVTTPATIPVEGKPFYTPWIYGEVSSTGSKTFDLYITNDTADFTDAEVWLEVEYLGTVDEAQSNLASDWRHNPATSTYITTTAAAQTDDTSSTWNGTGPSFTYKQKLSVTATVNETGQFRARVACAVANVASSRYFYVDPKVTVS